MFLYRDVEKSLKTHYRLEGKKVRDKTVDWTRTASLVLQKPNLENSEITNLYKFLNLVIKIEATMRKFIIKNFKEKFQKYAETRKEEIINPYQLGLRGLATFLQENNSITPEIFGQVIEIRDKRVSLFFDMGGFSISDEKVWSIENKNKLIENTEKILKGLEDLKK